MKNTQRPRKKTMIAVPAMDMCHTLFAKCLYGLQTDPGTPASFALGSLIYDARNQLAVEAIQRGVDRVLFLDSDMLFNNDLLERLQEDMDQTGAGVVCGLFVTRKPPIEPVIYSVLDMERADDMIRIRREIYTDYPKDSLFEIQACGFGAVLVSVKLFRTILEKEGLPFSPLPGLGEDVSFCFRARQLGSKIYCDSRVKLQHLGLYPFGEEDLGYGQEAAE